MKSHNTLQFRPHFEALYARRNQLLDAIVSSIRTWLCMTMLFYGSLFLWVRAADNNWLKFFVISGAIIQCIWIYFNEWVVAKYWRKPSSWYLLNLSFSSIFWFLPVNNYLSPILLATLFAVFLSYEIWRSLKYILFRIHLFISFMILIVSFVILFFGAVPSTQGKVFFVWLTPLLVSILFDLDFFGGFYWTKTTRRWKYDRLQYQAGNSANHRTFINRLITYLSTSKTLILRQSLKKFFVWFSISGLFLFVSYLILVSTTSAVIALNLAEGGISELESPLTTVPISTIFTLAVGCGFLSVIIYFLQGKLPKRVIILPFEPVGQKEDSELLSLSNLMTHALVEELQRIGRLLNTRQIENSYSTTNNDLYPVALTTGNSTELSQEIEQFVNIQLGNNAVQFTLLSFITRVTRAFAGITVQGTVQKRENGSVGIWTSLSKRGATTISAETSISPRNSSSDLDEITINKVARKLALKLVSELGGNQSVTITAQGLDAFLLGIEASGERKWYSAIANYRKAIDFEEAAGSPFGLGHYHLGAALTFAGEFEDGLRQFQIAEESGQPLPELQYMLARSTLSLYWNGLHTNPTAFDSIKRLCLLAVKSKTDFAEAHHLLGSAYYRRGRLQERDRTREYDDEKAGKFVSTSTWFYIYDYYFNYRRAIFHLRKSIKYYDREIQRQSGSSSDLLTQHKRVVEHLIEARFVATHQLADALRGSRRFEEAEVYYEEVLLIYPRNVRTLVDLSKTYCVAGRWEQALKFLERRVLTEEKVIWNADVNFYLGWSSLACFKAQLERSSSQFRYFFKWWGYSDYREVESKERIKQFAHCINHLSFAIHQRPRYIARWRQNNWLPQLESSLITLLQSEGLTTSDMNFNDLINSQLGSIYRESSNNLSDSNKDQHIEVIFNSICWLMMRIESCFFNGNHEKLSADFQYSATLLKHFVRLKTTIPSSLKIAFPMHVPRNISDIQSFSNDLEKLQSLYNRSRYMHMWIDTNRTMLQNKLRHWAYEMTNNMKKSIYATRSLESSCHIVYWTLLIDKSYDDQEELANEIAEALMTSVFKNQVYPFPAEQVKTIINEAIEKYYCLVNNQRPLNLRYHSIPFWIRLLEHRSQAAKLFSDLSKSDRNRGLINNCKKLGLASQISQEWNELIHFLEDKFGTFNNEDVKLSQHDLTFSTRLYVELVAGFALLIIRLYAEADAPDVALIIARKAQSFLDAWRDQWQATFGTRDREHYRLDYLVFRYQLSSLRAWCAYLEHQCNINIGVQLRSGKCPNLDAEALEKIQNVVYKAREMMQLHRLALFTQAQLFSNASIYKQQTAPIHAIPLLGEVLQLISPFDPFQYIDSWGPRYNIEKKSHKGNLLSQLDMASKICGQNQFDLFLSESRIHQELAEVRYQVGEIEPSIQHLHAAIVLSPHIDIETEVLTTLIRRLIFLERFGEAKAILDAMRLPTFQLVHQSLSVHKRWEPNLLECVILARQANHAESYLLARRLIRTFPLQIVEHHREYKNTDSEDPAVESLNENYLYVKKGIQHLIGAGQKDANNDEQLVSDISSDLSRWLQQYEFKWLDLSSTFDSPKNSSNTVQNYNIPHPDFYPNPFPKDFLTNIDIRKNETNIEPINGNQNHNDSNDNSVSLNLYNLAPRLFLDHKNAIRECLFLSLIRFSIDQDKLDKEGEESLNVDILSKLKEVITKGSKTTQDRIIRTQLILMFLDESVTALRQIAELSNTLAFSKTASTNERYELAFEDARYALLLLRFLKLGSERTIGKDLRAQINNAFANAYDSLGWVYYRIATTNTTMRKGFVQKIQEQPLPFLNLSSNPTLEGNRGSWEQRPSFQNFINLMTDESQSLSARSEGQILFYLARYQTELGLKHAPDRPIIHYHLARIHMSTLEHLWQSIVDKTNETNIASIAPYVSMHLRQADRHWDMAYKLDEVNRLHANLKWLRQRIDAYSSTWHQRQVSAFRGGFD